MSAVRIRIAGCRDPQANAGAHISKWLISFRRAHFGRDRYVAAIKTTDDPARARSFESEGQALAFWRQDVGRPRPDGRPNRPLTAWDIELDPVG